MCTPPPLHYSRLAESFSKLFVQEKPSETQEDQEAKGTKGKLKKARESQGKPGKARRSQGKPRHTMENLGSLWKSKENVKNKRKP